MADQDKEKMALIGEIVVSVADLSTSEAQRIADIAFGAKLTKSVNDNPNGDGSDKKKGA